MNSVLKHDRSADLDAVVVVDYDYDYDDIYDNDDEEEDDEYDDGGGGGTPGFLPLRRGAPNTRLGRSSLPLTPANAAHCASARQLALQMRHQRAAIQQ
jgi:hypothetical protein